MGKDKTRKDETSLNTELDAVLSRLTMDQIRFVIARQEAFSDKEAAENLNIKPKAVSNWKQSGAPIDEACHLMAMDGMITMLHIRRRVLAKAMAVKAAGLESDNERVRQSVATEIIEWESGKATQKQELTGANGGPIQTAGTLTIIEYDDDSA